MSLFLLFAGRTRRNPVFLYQRAEGQPSRSHNVPDGLEVRPWVLQAQRGAGRKGMRGEV